MVGHWRWVGDEYRDYVWMLCDGSEQVSIYFETDCWRALLIIPLQLHSEIRTVGSIQRHASCLALATDVHVAGSSRTRRSIYCGDDGINQFHRRYRSQ